MLPRMHQMGPATQMVLRLLSVCLPVIMATPANGETVYRFSEQDSTLEVLVPRAGLLKALGHDHTILADSFSGSVGIETGRQKVTFLELRADSPRLRVIDAAVSEEIRAKIQQTMLGEAVLHSEAHPEIWFSASGIRIVSGNEWEISGMLNIREQAHPISFSAKVLYPGEGRLRASGLIELKPEDFGIQPVTALAGSIRTAATIFVRFQISANSTATE